jgi:hypothetical protein
LAPHIVEAELVHAGHKGGVASTYNRNSRSIEELMVEGPRDLHHSHGFRANDMRLLPR